jgi:hypothetical protein
VVIMRQFASALIAIALALVTACDESVTVAPTTATLPSGTPAPSPSTSGPPYTIVGRVTDSRGAPVAGAEIWIYGNDSPIDHRYGVTFTDSGGRYSVTSAQRVPHEVRALKDTYVPRDVPIRGLASSSTWTADITIAHIDRYHLFAPPTVAVGDQVRPQAQIDLDDGSSSTGFLFMQLSSNNPSILSTDSVGWITGVAPGTATITARYYGATTTARVLVYASTQ